MKRTVLLIFLLVTGLLLLGLAAPALAQGGGGGNGGGSQGRADPGRADHDRAREAVSREDARPLAAILPAIERRYRARMVGLELGSHGGRLVYEIELVTAAGRIIEVVVDAATGGIVSGDTADEDGRNPED